MGVLVVGCGFLGRKVGRLWLKDGISTHCITRSTERSKTFADAGYLPLVADITMPESLAKSKLTDVQTVLFSVGFDRIRYQDIREVYVVGLKNVLEWLPKSIQQFIYVSSTGVYGNCDGEWIDESSPTDPQRPGGRACLEAETLIRESWIADKATILRLAGIYGPNRIPRLDAIRNQQWESLGQSGHINLIHVDDAAGIICDLAQQKIVNELFLVSDGNPPKRTEFYEFIADVIGTGPIDWSVAEDPKSGRRASADKKVSNRKLAQRIAFQYSYPDFRSGIRHALA